MSTLYMLGTEYETHDELVLFSNKLFQEILTFFTDTIEQTGLNDRKMLFYSGHDTNILALLSIFNLTSFECIHKNETTKTCIHEVLFASQVILELEKNLLGKYFVHVIYNGVEYNICDGQVCTWEQFNLYVLNKYIVGEKEYQDLCGSYAIQEDVFDETFLDKY